MSISGRLRRPARDIRTIRLLLTDAEARAAGAGDGLAGAEHLILAALDLPDGTARRAFARVRADAGGFAAAVELQHAAALGGLGPSADPAPDLPDPPPPRGPLRTGASLQEVFQGAVAIAKEGRPRPLVGAHVIQAAAALEHGTVPRTLAAMGIDPASLEAAAREEAAAADA